MSEEENSRGFFVITGGNVVRRGCFKANIFHFGYEKEHAILIRLKSSEDVSIENEFMQINFLGTGNRSVEFKVSK